MFRSAYLKLTLFYVCLLMVLSFLFSVWLYREATRELNIGLHAPFAVRVQDTNGNSRTYLAPPESFDRNDFIADRITEGKRRIIANLVLLNVVILVTGGAVSYWLARRTMEPIEKAMEAQNRFTADASHELRTPLAAMKVGMEVFLRSNKKLPAEQRELLESNLEEVDRLTKLSQNLLLLSNSDEETPFEAVQLDELVKNISERLSPLAHKKDISIKVTTKPIAVLGHEQELEQVATILLENAIKYSDKKTKITIEVMPKENHALITVTDQGTGISKDDMAHIFERFYRADNARTNGEAGGHGLGLPIAKKIVTEHHGSISVQSEPTKGSVFTVRLPIKK